MIYDTDEVLCFTPNCLVYMLFYGNYTILWVITLFCV